MNTFFIILVWLISLYIAAEVIFILRTKFIKETPKERVPNLEAVRILLEDNSIEKINKLIDDFIDNYINVYVTMTTTWEKTQYINSAEQDKMIKYVTFMVNENISDTLKDTIGLVYNIKNEEELRKFLDLRIKLYMITFLIQFNSEYEE